MNSKSPMALDTPQASRETTLRIWPGILISILFHAAVLSLPVVVSMPGETVCQRLALVIEQADGIREKPVMEIPHNPEGGKLPAPVPAAPETPQAAKAESVAQTMHEEEPQEPDASEVNAPVEPPVNVTSPTVVQVRKQPELKRVKSPPKPPVTHPRNKPLVRESPPSTEPVQAEASVAKERQETAALGNPSSSIPTPSSEESAAGHGPIDTPFGSRDGPRFMKKAIPRYPRLARELGKEGTVLLQLVIDERGRILDVQVLKQAGSGFDEEALRAVRDSTFSPAKRNGRPVMCKARLPIQFVLRDAHND
ncbi:MAG: energy transducer TonB [Deltaproteobacteria bacterium]|nr:energy transducer TonB [Deltaproteobacteria bacterium]